MCLFTIFKSKTNGYLEELFGEVVEDRIENIFGKAKSEPDSPVNLHSSIIRKKGSKKRKLKLKQEY